MTDRQIDILNLAIFYELNAKVLKSENDFSIYLKVSIDNSDVADLASIFEAYTPRVTEDYIYISM